MSEPSVPEDEALSPALRRRIDQACNRFEAAWRAGSPLRIENLLDGWEEPERSALLRELVLLDLDYRRGRGERCRVEDYKPFPTLDPAWLEGVVPPAPPKREARPVGDAPGDKGAVGAPMRTRSGTPGALTMRLILTAIEGPHTGQIFTFTQHDTFLVGRSKQAQFRLRPGKEKDLYVSRIHFMVEVNPPLCRLLDMNSRNGTRVNKEKVKSADLKHGDEIRVGNTTLRVSLQESPEEETGAWSDVFEISGAGPAVLPARPAVPPPLLPPPEPPRLAKAGDAAACAVCQRPLANPAGLVCPACRRQAVAREQPIPGYVLLRILGQGGMGIVHLAQREADGALVAVKMIVPAVAASVALVHRFLREATILRQLEHPHIVSFRDLGEAAGRLYFVMDYVPGTDAARLLKEQKRLPVRTAVRLVNQLLLALEYAHGKGFVHRDVKPANLLIRMDARPHKAMAADFGLARVYQASKLSGLTLLGDVGGTVGFMPPEQILSYREAKPAADQYSAAATLYNLLTGQYVHDPSGDVPTQLDKILNADAVPIRRRRQDIPPRLAAVVHRALARAPEDRYDDVGAFRRALAPFGR